MSRASVVNLVCFTLSVVASMMLAIERPATSDHVPHGETPDEGPRSLVDATGFEIEVTARQRIVSASTVADQILLEVCDAPTIVAVTALSANGREAHRFRGRAVVGSIDDTEAIVALAPELVLVHNVADTRRVARLREAGLTVFDLGVLEGVSTLGDDIVVIGTLCGARARAIAFRDTFIGRLHRLESAVEGPHTQSMYLAVYGDRVFGGTEGSSYHDVLRFAGLDDVAASRYRGWPQYSSEEILELDPDTIVTRDGMTALLCRSGLSTLRACREGRVFEIDGKLLDDPGLGILVAAEALQATAYPQDL